MRGFFLAAISLAVLEAAVSSTGAAQRAGTILALPGTIARYIISPTVPAIPELRKRSTSTSTSADNPFAQAALNQQLISATWSTQSAAPSTATVATAPLSPTTIGV